MKPLVVIPARAGSKGLPKKNKKHLGGKPLIRYTIDAALTQFSADCICVSTDDPEICEIAADAGLIVPFTRPSHLATDTASSLDVILHALNYYAQSGYEADTIVLLQPTSPFRSGLHIAGAMSLFNNFTEMVVSVREAKSNPYFTLYEEDAAGYLQASKPGNFIRRQDCPKIWEFNGAIYIIQTEALKNFGFRGLTRIVKFEMTKYSSLDIDDEIDWMLAEQFLSKSGNI